MPFAEQSPPASLGLSLPDPPWLRSTAARQPEVLVWGAHGGAGTSTLARWLHPARDLGAMRRGPRPRYPAAETGNGRPLIITCRNTAKAAQAATAAVAAVSTAGGHVSVLAVVSDGWPEPSTATTRFRLLAPHVGGVVRIPFIPGLRLADDPAAVPLPGRARRAISQIRFAASVQQRARWTSTRRTESNNVGTR